MPGEVASEVCPRCGHAFQEPVSALGRLGRLGRRGVGRKVPRVQCGEPTDHGWACTCRSRFHAGLQPAR